MRPSRSADPETSGRVVNTRAGYRAAPPGPSDEDDRRPPVSGLDGEARSVMARVARTFDLATGLLPGHVRTDVRRLYLVLRTLDDLVDTGNPAAAARVEAVEAWASGDEAHGQEVEILDDLSSRHPALPRDALLDFCAGMRADLAGPRHATDDDLDRYCYQVAGTVGRLMAVILGIRPGAESAADDAARALGAAMQRTNILRDIVEDARGGRVYLPATTLARAGIGTPGAAGDEDALRPAERADSMDAARELAAFATWPTGRRRAVIEPEIRRADADYARGLAGVGTLVRGRRAILAAGRMYREILREIERGGFGGNRRRAVVSRPRKAAIVLRALVTGR